MYITYDEYKLLGEYPTITELEFEKYEKKASVVLDALTRHFYRNRSLNSDVAFRKDAFKMAMVEQVDYMKTNGTTKIGELGDELSSVTMGRTSVSYDSNSNSGTGNTEYSEDVLMFLSGTGLLYRGLGRC